MPDEIYVRRPDEKQSWLAEGSLQADADPTSWLDRDIMNISHDRIASVAVGDQALIFGRVDGKFALTQPADHPKLEDYKVDDVARALECIDASVGEGRRGGAGVPRPGTRCSPPMTGLR